MSMFDTAPWVPHTLSDMNNIVVLISKRAELLQAF